jgi:predicted nuclease with TOPRIM domain
MNELEKENSRLNEIIQQKDERIDDLLQRLDNLVVAYQESIQNQCKCSPEKNETND